MRLLDLLAEVPEVDDGWRYPAVVPLRALSEPAPRSAYQALFDAHAAALRRYARRLVGSRETAEDLVQEVFLRLWLSWDRVDVGAGTRAYLYMATRDRALDHLRRARRDVVALDAAAVADAEAIACPAEAEEALVREELGAAVAAVLARMPPRQREVARLRVREGRSTAEIAAALGISPRTVELHVARATKAFRAALPELVGEGAGGRREVGGIASAGSDTELE